MNEKKDYVSIERYNALLKQNEELIRSEGVSNFINYTLNENIKKNNKQIKKLKRRFWFVLPFAAPAFLYLGKKTYNFVKEKVSEKNNVKVIQK